MKRVSAVFSLAVLLFAGEAVAQEGRISPEQTTVQVGDIERPRAADGTPATDMQEGLSEEKLSEPNLTGEGSRTVFVKHSVEERPLVVLDPGHGGEDVGAVGPDGLREKEVVLEIALEVKKLLEERLRARVLLTRSTDVFIPLQERIAFANAHKAALFISIHANASGHKSASGIETYYLDNTEDRSSLKLAERENSSIRFVKGGGDHDLGFMVSDLIQNAKLEDSITLSHHIQEELHSTLSRHYPKVNDLGVKKAPFFVLVGAHMPCVLAEISFIDHPIEGRRLAKENYRTLIAQGLFKGVTRYFERQESAEPLKQVAIPVEAKKVM